MLPDPPFSPRFLSDILFLFLSPQLHRGPAWPSMLSDLLPSYQFLSGIFLLPPLCLPLSLHLLALDPHITPSYPHQCPTNALIMIYLLYQYFGHFISTRLHECCTIYLWVARRQWGFMISCIIVPIVV